MLAARMSEERARLAESRRRKTSTRPDQRVTFIDRHEIGIDRRREGRVVELDRVIQRVVLGSPLPRGAYLDVASHYTQVRSFLVLGEFGRKEARLDVQRER